MTTGLGALPYQTIVKMIGSGCITGAALEQAEPASLDLTMSQEVYRVHSVFLPRPGESVLEAMPIASPEVWDTDIPLEVGVTYLVRLNEQLVLPNDIYGYANPKSSTGRNDIHVRLLADGITRFDSVGTNGYRGSLWALITPRSYRVKLQEGNSLIQLRFFNHDTRFEDEADFSADYQHYQFLFDAAGQFIDYSRLKMKDRDGSLILTINLTADIVGYRCEASQKVLDLSNKDFYNPLDFFTPIPRPNNDVLVLRKGDFYILFTNEYLRVPPEFAAEMAPIDTRAGDYRAQYAGYFDPGWGYGLDGSLKGAPAVLEVRPFEDNLIIRHNQPICKMTFERMAEVPTRLYGHDGSHYLHQTGPRLSKHFKN